MALRPTRVTVRSLCVTMVTVFSVRNSGNQPYTTSGLAMTLVLRLINTFTTRNAEFCIREGSLLTIPLQMFSLLPKKSSNPSFTHCYQQAIDGIRHALLLTDLSYPPCPS